MNFFSRSVPPPPPPPPRFCMRVDILITCGETHHVTTTVCLGLLNCVVSLCFVCLLPVSCVPDVSSVSGLSICYSPLPFSKTLIHKATFHWCVCAKPGQWVVMCMCVGGIEITSIYDSELFRQCGSFSFHFIPRWVIVALLPLCYLWYLMDAVITDGCFLDYSVTLPFTEWK